MKYFVLLLAFLVLVSGCVQYTYEKSKSSDQIRDGQNAETGFEKVVEKDIPKTQHGDEYAQPKQSVLFTELSGCEEKDVEFTHSPLDIQNIKAVEPQGELTNAGHIIPGDHVGFQYDSKAPAISLYAPADGYIKRVERNRPFGDLKSKNYHLYFEFSCSVLGDYVHVTEIAPEVLEADPEFKKLDSYPKGSVPEDKRYIWPKIPVKAGQLIGKVQEWGLLGMLTVDTDVKLTGYLNPEKYKGEPWRIHAVPPFDYFTPELKNQLMGKNPRTKEPRGGKADFDVEGRLVGNWFSEGTDLSGTKESLPAFCGDNLCPYWTGHLSFVYDFVDPDQTRVSFGDYSGWQPQGPYGVKGNTDPADLGKEDGLVKLELVSLDDFSDECGFPSEGKVLCTKNTDTVVGVMLVQMLEDRKIKAETFPEKTAGQVSGFTENAKIYER